MRNVIRNHHRRIRNHGRGYGAGVDHDTWLRHKNPDHRPYEDLREKGRSQYHRAGCWETYNANLPWKKRGASGPDKKGTPPPIP